MNRIRVLFSVGLLLAVASLASAGSFSSRTTQATPEGVVCEDGTICTVDMSACPGGGPNCCQLPCSDDDAATTVAAK